MTTPQDAATAQEITTAVQRLYNTYPFPPEPLLDEAPPGYNWRWSWPAAYAFCTGRAPEQRTVKILDAGCGTGVSTEYLAHLNPQASVTGIDLSPEAVAIARERCRRSGAQNAHFHTLSLYDVASLGETYDLINCVGVLHHLPNPVAGLQAIAAQLNPGGILHIFVYAELGRWEITLMQQALALLQGEQRGDFEDGVSLGRQVFAALPENNRLRRREQERWSLENQRDECFADMYLHPQEIDYNVDTLFNLIDASGLEFVGFSNPAYWDLSRLLGQEPTLIDRARYLSSRQRYRLIELLDPEVTHYEFFLGRPPLLRYDWKEDSDLLQAIAERHPCVDGWPGKCLFNPDYQVVDLSEPRYEWLKAIEGGQPVAEALSAVPEMTPEDVRWLMAQKLILLTPTSP
ncbi:bifunctional 2-polyprenyl-6-hydroxyphenol methylase/3-demethylubiquinol 3-O-methyltransferase UbiG [Leptolyngbya sp. FACHB-261]|uniref:class I SAM-dependent methyltransferase n=1 Tax=Leptolyngbya sp. FACHB-261 TaxID=2692806 RepID=UPI001687836F|nr:class I SAM-dependent methyltransferase [Leptolyngbya sp. FACHB-261]MBD2100605.1 class I SAM-dependent methyltransferase [Leptolyngbya sp. FACHB-261]